MVTTLDPGSGPSPTFVCRALIIKPVPSQLLLQTWEDIFPTQRGQRLKKLLFPEPVGFSAVVETSAWLCNYRLMTRRASAEASYAVLMSCFSEDTVPGGLGAETPLPSSKVRALRNSPLS